MLTYSCPTAVHAGSLGFRCVIFAASVGVGAGGGAVVVVVVVVAAAAVTDLLPLRSTNVE